jgi:Leucine-rich repeat (LRR) protein
MDICGLEQFKVLKVLNLEFNQIKVLKGTEQLLLLEELYISYNEI